MAAFGLWERLDGSGYPPGLRGGEILPEASLLAVADVVEAMASHRPYRPAPTLDQARDGIGKDAHGRFDEASATACRGLLEAGAFEFPE